ncbi:MAG: hypothetical protein J3K34DRAFT_525791 [Monoraphidium minutum]|nr:MAG: hypothetical protein J3K34DRAFT_525791 [Monoraphidium minutum]
MATTITSAANAFWASDASALPTHAPTVGAVYAAWGVGAPATNGVQDDGTHNVTISAKAPFGEVPDTPGFAYSAYLQVLEDDPSDQSLRIEPDIDMSDAVKLLSFATATFISDGGGGEDPHLQGFNGAAYEFCGAALGPQCHGRPFNLLTEARHQFNAEVNRHHATGDRDEFPAAGSWLTAIGLRYGPSFSVVLRMRTDVANVDGPKTRALHPSAGGGAGAFRELLQSVQVNGADAMARVGSGETQQFEGGVSVHWPAVRHQGDAQDGPVAVITTPNTTWTWYLESEDTWHLDFKVSLRAGARLGRTHGLLGQSLEWARGAPAVVEGGDDLQYALADGLLGTAFKFNAFTGARARRPAVGTRALRTTAGAARAAGTPAALARGN